eukprot:364899-Chlamydomonas_euryale.AAC.9
MDCDTCVCVDAAERTAAATRVASEEPKATTATSPGIITGTTKQMEPLPPPPATFASSMYPYCKIADSSVPAHCVQLHR